MLASMGTEGMEGRIRYPPGILHRARVRGCHMCRKLPSIEPPCAHGYVNTISETEKALTGSKDHP